MGEIRPLEREDIPQAASLIELLLGSGSRARSPRYESLLERTLLDHPWADADIPSLVHVGPGGAVTGFVGAQVRRMRFDGEPIRAACVSNLVAAPVVERPIGVLLLRRLLGGPQELTLTDNATEPVRQMWERLGGEPVYVSCLRWLRVFRPWGFVVHRQSERRHDHHVLPPRPLRAAAAALDAVTRSPARGPLRPDAPPSSSEPLTPETLLRHLPSISSGLRLAPDYDRESLDWLFDTLARKDMGEPVARLVKEDGRPLGWFVYYLRPGGICRIATVAATKGDVGAVLDHLLHDADRRGAGALLGRVEPRLLWSLWSRRTRLRYGTRMVIHSERPEILHSIHRGRAHLTPLEGEWIGVD